MRALRDGRCDAALAGGVNLILRIDGHLSFSLLEALSPSGRCRSFDDGADGYIRSEGCGLVLLKRLTDAERDGDLILAVIKGGAVNHNGRSGGLTVPSGPAQESLVRAALTDAQLTPRDLDYLEAHGSATRLGDPQELTALAHVFRERSQSLWLGSVKSNLGHLESAAGVAGLIKLVLMLQERRLVPNLHFNLGNRLVDWSALPLEVVTDGRDWPETGGRPRYAGISSFGISGTNAHLVLGEYQPVATAPAVAPRRGSYVFTLSARSAAGLQATLEDWAARDDLAALPFADLCHAVNRSRSGHPWRFAAVADDFAAVLKQLSDWQPQRPAPTPQHTVFMFTGQGSVYPGIGRGLYDSAPAFRTAFDLCAQLFAPHLGLSLKVSAFDGSAADLGSARVSQALIFTIEYALTALWRTLGVQPTLVLGHSIGEYAAACVAGILELEDAVALVALRGAIMDDTPSDGAMAGLLSDEATARGLLAGQSEVFIAAINTDSNCTLSGRAAGMKAVLAAARKARLFTEVLPMRHAFHSPLMAASADKLAAGLIGVRFHEPRIPLISSQTGGLLSRAAEMDAAYWSAHLCHPVRFRDAFKAALAQGAETFVEIGGTAALSGLAAQIASDDCLAFLPSLRESKDAWLQINQSLAALYLRGHAIAWQACHGPPRPVPTDLPNTHYERQRYWFEDLRSQAAGLAPTRATVAARPLAAGPESDASDGLRADITRDIRDIIGRVAGFRLDQIGDDAHIFELGLDSLMLMQMDKRLVKRFGVSVPVSRFFSELHTPALIAGYIETQLSSEARASLRPAPVVVPEAVPAAVASDLAGIVAAQLDLMRQQLALLRGETPVPIAPSAVAPTRIPAPRPAATAGENALRGMTLHQEDVNDEQLAFIRGLAERVATKTPNSKAYAQRYRTSLADWITTLNFSLTLKEMSYPVVAARARGSHFQDIDGNDYLDTAACYGAMFFGHNADFIMEAIQAQLEQGMILGPQMHVAGEVAAMICRLTGAERVAFSNSGTEAVMVALRLARAVTRRPKIVRFINSYHGSFDGVLAEAGEEGALPMAPGIVESMIQDTVVVPYGGAASLAAIRAVGGELAGVLVEPVQSRAPHNHSREFLQALRDLTDELGAALIFDEMITGFRIHPGGVQAYYGIRADLATYGKVVGGGLPIGVVAGRSRFMDAIDGGAWEFGDDSGPTRETTFFAGTFCKHPLAMAAAHAVLSKLEAEGTQLIDRVNALTRRFCERANALFAAEAVPLEAHSFGSLYRFESRLTTDPAHASLEVNLLFRLMQLDGVYVWERRTSFFTLAHSEEDAEHILVALRQAVAQLRRGGFRFRLAQRLVSADLPVDLPLSSEERRMYVLSLIKGGEYAYHVTGALSLTGAVSPQHIAQALAGLAQRHPLLRVGYVWHDGAVVRRQTGTVSIPLAHRECRVAELDGLLHNLIQPFTLSQPPLWRAALVRLQDRPGEQVLFLDLHHLIADGIAFSILVEEFLQLYRNEALAPVSAAYADFVAWEQAFMASPEYEQQRQYWLARLQPLPALLALPTDYPRPPHNDFAGASQRFLLGPDLQAAVRELARVQRVTPYMVLLTAYFVLLGKLCRQDDLCIGTPLDRRGNGNFERTVGMFAQTLIIRAQASDDKPFAQLLNEVRQACIDAYAQPNCSLDELVSSLKLPRDFSRNPLFDTMFIFENGNRRVGDGADFRVDARPVPSRGSAFDVTLEITEQQGCLHGHFIYAQRLFTEATMVRWAHHFECLLRGILAQPDSRLQGLSLLTDTDRTALLEGFNQTQRPFPRQETLVSRWQAAVAAGPQDPALVFAERELTYAELDVLSDELAHHLVAAEVRRGDYVGILLPRGLGMIAAMLATLKVGAAYVPLDPEYPAARIAYMLDKSRISVLLVTAELSRHLDFNGRVLDPERLWPVGPQGAIVPPRADDLAYVIFTSGSTGQPKGVMIEHASVVNFLYAMAHALELPPRPRVLGLTTISFDIFVLEVFLTLVSGGTLVLAGETAQRDPGELAGLIRASGVNVVQATPSRIQALLASHVADQVFADVRHLLLGGEAFPAALLAPLQAVPGLRLFNVYGPTETTVWSTVKELTRAESVTLGRPIANTRCYVLDMHWRPQPIGCVGDLWIAGDGLARGYLDDPEKTAAVFLIDPFVAAGRMYGTGDKAAWTADGELVYCGRSDSQIKLRGYRIELQEIEAVLQRHPALALAAVVVRELSPGNPILIAYCEVRPDGEAQLAGRPLAEVLRAHAARELPAYMVPTMAFRVDSLPRTPNGKINRASLPELLPASVPVQVPESGSDVSTDALERDIIRIWQRILGERPIGTQDSFFDVGGNSFSLVSMHAALAELYPGVLEVADIFANPTVAALKQRIAASLGASQPLPPELPFPSALLAGVDGPIKAETLNARLEPETCRQLISVAGQLAASPFEVATVLFGLYLHKLTGAVRFELAVAFPGRHEYQSIDMDFDTLRGLRQLAAWVRRQAESAGLQPLPEPVGVMPHALPEGVRPLLLDAASHGGSTRYGFDLVLRLRLTEDRFAVRLDYDGGRLAAPGMTRFVANYLKFVKALVGGGQAPTVALTPPTARDNHHWSQS